MCMDWHAVTMVTFSHLLTTTVVCTAPNITLQLTHLSNLTLLQKRNIHSAAVSGEAKDKFIAIIIYKCTGKFYCAIVWTLVGPYKFGQKYVHFKIIDNYVYTHN